MSRIYAWTRDVHLYFGLFTSPWILAFALSVIFLNHTWDPGEPSGDVLQSTAVVDVPPGFDEKEGMERVQLAKQILDQLGVSGEIGYISHRKQDQHYVIPVSKPGWQATVELNAEDGSVAVEEQYTGTADALNYLHKSPGPHNVNIRGNWLLTRVWKSSVDTFVYLLLLISASGIYLWLALRAERKAGLVALASGAVCFLTILFALCA
jgi:hypothetical protein